MLKFNMLLFFDIFKHLLLSFLLNLMYLSLLGDNNL